MFNYNTKIGNVRIVEEEGSIINLLFKDEEYDNAFIIKETPLLKTAFNQLEEYMNGKIKQFNLPINFLFGDNEFKNEVLSVVQKIKYGTTLTYKQVAKEIDNLKAVRAVGNAINKNPLPIIIPCHRVIGSNGKLTGYKGGLEIKRFLLDLEKSN